MAVSTTVRLLSLSDSFFVEYGDKDHISGLRDAIVQAQRYEERNGLPICDYKKYRQPTEEPVHPRISLRTKFNNFLRKRKIFKKMNIVSYREYEQMLYEILDKYRHYQKHHPKKQLVKQEK